MRRCPAVRRCPVAGCPVAGCPAAEWQRRPEAMPHVPWSVRQSRTVCVSHCLRLGGPFAFASGGAPGRCQTNPARHRAGIRRHGLWHRSPSRAPDVTTRGPGAASAGRGAGPAIRMVPERPRHQPPRGGPDQCEGVDGHWPPATARRSGSMRGAGRPQPGGPDQCEGVGGHWPPATGRRSRPMPGRPRHRPVATARRPRRLPTRPATLHRRATPTTSPTGLATVHRRAIRPQIEPVPGSPSHVPAWPPGRRTRPRGELPCSRTRSWRRS